MSYWVTFEDRTPACVLDDSSAPKFGKVRSIDPLPYPADPVLDDRPGRVPSFCYTPEKCKGHSSCQKNWACSE